MKPGFRRYAVAGVAVSLCLGLGGWVVADGGTPDPGAHFIRDGEAVVAARVRVRVIAPDAIQISVRQASQPAQTPGTGRSDTPVVSPDFAPATNAILSARFTSRTAMLSTAAMRIEFDHDPLEVRVFDSQNQLLTRVTHLGEAGPITLRHNADRFYGVASSDVWGNIEDRMLRPDGGIVQAGIQGSANGPWIFSNRFGVLVDSDGGQFLADPDTLKYRYQESQTPDVFVIVGPPRNTLSRLAAISGLPPMFPKWALGFINSQWGLTQPELESIIATYRQKNIPLDAFGLDFDFKAWGEDNYGEFRWNAAKFPDGPSGTLAARLAQQQVNLIGIMKPRIIERNGDGSFTRAALALEALGCWYPDEKPYLDYFAGLPARDVNFNKPECRAWYWERSRDFAQTGIAGWWNDEADVNAEGLVFDARQATGMARAMYEGQRRENQNRVLTLNRSFFLGAQRYAYALWSGDIESNFDSMARQPTRMLASANAGVSSWTMDAGGFINNPPASSETYARWIQFGAFTPLFRVHGYENETRQPWRYGPIAEAAATDAIRLRYQLLPYIYAHERTKHDTGLGLVRPMFFEFPDDPALANITGQWMFGESLLVSPVMAPGQTSHSVYLPRGVWTNYATGERALGPGTIQLPIDPIAWKDIPLFAREGAIIPTQRTVNHTGDGPIREINLDVFPGPEISAFDYYDDDGATYGYEQGAFFSQTLSARRAGGEVRFTISPVSGAYRPALEHYIVRLRHTRASAVRFGGADLARVDGPGALEAVDLGWATAQDALGDVTLIKLPAGVQADLVAAEGPLTDLRQVRPARPDIALKGFAVASSLENQVFLAANAVDGDSNTRWSSLAVDDAWLTVDLGRVAQVSEIALNWETATARDYTLQIGNSPDGPWKELIQVRDNLSAGRVRHAVQGRGRYVRLSMTRRSGDWGYSIYDFEIYGTPGETITDYVPLCGGPVGAEIETWRPREGGGIWEPDAHGGTIQRLETALGPGPESLARVRGRLCPPVSGYYIISLASNAGSEFRLNGSPAITMPVALVAQGTAPREWRKALEQRSAPIYLSASSPADFEIRWQRKGPESHLAAAWEGPGISRRIITGPDLIRP